MSFSPKSLPDLTGFEVCTPVNSLREKVFSCCSNSLMGFPPVLGDPSKYSRISANCTQPEVWTRKPLCGLHQPVLSTGNWGHQSLFPEVGPHSVDLICTSVCFILYGDYISWDVPNFNRLRFRYTPFIPQSEGAKVWCPFNQAQPTPNGSCRDFPDGSEVPMQGTRFWSLVRELAEKAMAPHSSTLAWKIPWMEEPGRLQSMGSLRVGHDWATLLSLFTLMHWRRKWQPTPVFLPGESQGRGSLLGCRLWGRTESDTTEVT